MTPTLTPCKFQDPAYNGGAISDGFITSDGYLIEPGNTNGWQVDPWGWYLAQFEAANLALDAHTAGLVRGECAATGITPESTWEYIGKPLVVMAAAIAGGEFLGASGAAAGASSSGAGLAPTVIASSAAPAAAAPVSLAGVSSVTGTLADIGSVGAVSGAGAAITGALTTAGSTALTQVAKTAGGMIAAKALAPSGAPTPIPLGAVSVTAKRPTNWLSLLLLAALGIGAAVMVT